MKAENVMPSINKAVGKRFSYNLNTKESEAEQILDGEKMAAFTLPHLSET